MLMDLHEILQDRAYAALLTESARLDYLKKNFGERLEAKASNDPQTVALGIHNLDGETLGDKVIAYIVNYDPSRNKQYSQWMVHRYLKNEVTLEDMYKAAEYMAVFERAKPRLEKKDINTYKTFGELFVAIRPFIEGNEPVSANAEKREVRQRMRSDENINVIYDEDDMLIVVPKNIDAAKFWGRGTQWCTSAENNNMFTSYNRDGPLYIILERATGDKFQFHFPSNQYMDVNDSRINLNDFVRRHPNILKILGEDNFLKAATDGRLSLEFISPELRAKLERRKLAAAIMTGTSSDQLLQALKDQPEDITSDPLFLEQVIASMGRYANTISVSILLWVREKNVLPSEATARPLSFYVSTLEEIMLLPPELQADSDFAEVVLRNHPDAKDILRFFLKTKAATDEIIDAIIPVSPSILKTLLPRMLTDERKILASTNTQLSSAGLNNVIPKPWPKEVSAEYWRRWSGEGGHSQRELVSQIPEEFRTPQIVEAFVLAKVPSYSKDERDHALRMKRFLDDFQYLPKDRVSDVQRRRMFFLKWCPEKYLTDELLEMFTEQVQRKMDKTNFLYSAGDYGGSQYGIEKKYVWEVYERFPMAKWPDIYFVELLTHVRRNGKVKFAQIPESKRTPEVVTAFLDKYNLDRKTLAQVDDSYLTPELVSKLVRYNLDRLAWFSEEVLPEKLACEIAADSYGLGNEKWKGLPKRLRTADMAKVFIEKAALSITEMPPVLATDAAYATRIKYNPDEFKEIPAARITPVSVIKFVLEQPLIMPEISDSFLTEPLLYAYLRGEKAKNVYEKDKPRLKQQFARFPKTMWSDRVVALAIWFGLVEPKATEIPKEALGAQATTEILRRDANEAGMVPEDLLDEATLVEVVKTNVQILGSLDKSKITEPVIYSAITSHASYAGSRTWDNSTELLLGTDRKLWSERVYRAAVGYIVSLKEVPRKWRSNELERTAISRDPYNIRYVGDTIAWLDAHADEIKTKMKDWHWLQKFENAGYFKSGKNFIDIEDLTKTEVPSGAFVFNKSGKAMRLFLFDKNNKLLGRIYTDKGKWVLPYESGIRNYRDLVIQALDANSAIKDAEAGSLNQLDIYDARYDYCIPVERLPRKKEKEDSVLEWSQGDTQTGGDAYNAWANGKRVVEVIYGTTTGWGNSTSGVHNVKVYDWPLALKNVSEIKQLFVSSRFGKGWAPDLWKLGMYTSASGGPWNRTHAWNSVREKKVFSFGKMSVWRGGPEGRKLGLFGPEGMIATAYLRKDQTITQIKMSNRWEEIEDEVNTIFALVQKRIKPGKE